MISVFKIPDKRYISKGYAKMHSLFIMNSMNQVYGT